MFQSRTGDLATTLAGLLTAFLVLGLAYKVLQGLDLDDDLLALLRGDLGAIFPLQIVAAYLTGTFFTDLG